MNNDELKKKIMEIIDASCSFYSGSSVHMDDEQEKAIADALIAAGIGDVKDAEHRAIVAERALEERATYRAMKDLDYFSLTTVAVESRAKELYNEWVQQAEKDLAKGAQQ